MTEPHPVVHAKLVELVSTLRRSLNSVEPQSVDGAIVKSILRSIYVSAELGHTASSLGCAHAEINDLLVAATEPTATLIKSVCGALSKLVILATRSELGAEPGRGLTTEPYLDIVLAPVEGSPDMVFVEVETHEGKSVRVGVHFDRGDGTEAIRVTLESFLRALGGPAEAGRPAIVELMGHGKAAGFITTTPHGYTLRVPALRDVVCSSIRAGGEPVVKSFPAYQLELGPGAVFAVRYVSVDACLGMAAHVAADDARNGGPGTMPSEIAEYVADGLSRLDRQNAHLHEVEGVRIVVCTACRHEAPHAPVVAAELGDTLAAVVEAVRNPDGDGEPVLFQTLKHYVGDQRCVGAGRIVDVGDDDGDWMGYHLPSRFYARPGLLPSSDPVLAHLKAALDAWGSTVSGRVLEQGAPLPDGSVPVKLDQRIVGDGNVQAGGDVKVST